MYKFFAKDTFKEQNTGNTERINIAATETVYTNPLKVGDSSNFSLEFLAEGAAIDVNADVEVSYDGTNFVQYDTYSSPLKNIVAAGRSILSFTIPPCAFVRLKYVGQAGNHATTSYITARLGKIIST